MIETTEQRSADAATDHEGAGLAPGDRPKRLAHIAVWVGLIAGVALIVAVVLLSGFFLGRHSSSSFDMTDRGDGYGMHHGDGQMGPGGMMGPGQEGPGGTTGPNQMGPGGTTGPGQQTPNTTPASPSPPQR